MAVVQASLGQAVRAATHRALAAREQLLSDYPQWEDWRQEVRSAKARVMGRWQEYVDLLREKVKAWGGNVHLAGDALEARHFILEVARKHGVCRVVQSKSMTAHEIGLEPFLRDHGIHLTESDLGEFIIQLAGHAPAHLTAPALHLNRYQIADILSEHLNLTAPADPQSLTRLTTANLAPRYAEAEMGITGVNFAAARDGTLVCLENEGNLRLTASLPPVHLALMGWEKMLPSLSDLAPCLRLLPASATGQRLTSLVHFFQGLKTGPKGSQDFYLVILDNGRSRLAAHPELRESLHCLRCGACLNICPVFQVGGAHLYGRVYSGAIGILLAPFLPPYGDISDLCTQCGSCRDICPAAIELPKKIRLLRRDAPHFRRARTLTAATGLIMGHPVFYRTLEVPARLVARSALRRQAQELFGGEALRESFFRRQQRQAGQKAASHPAPPKLAVPLEHRHFPHFSPQEMEAGEGIPSRPDSDANRMFKEAGASLLSLGGPQALARYLKETALGEVWLEDHPWLLPVVQELNTLGTRAHLAQDHWGPEADTAVTLGLGIIPELGAVLVPGGQGLAAWLSFRARRHVVLVPVEQACLDIPEALALVRQHQGSLVTWLTGPTRTADIEKILVLGAQGPADLTIVLYQPHPPGE